MLSSVKQHIFIFYTIQLYQINQQNQNKLIILMLESIEQKKSHNRYVIRKKQEPQAPHSNNIFEISKTEQPFQYDEFNNIKKYSIAGDKNFVKKFMTKNKRSFNGTTQNLQKTNKSQDVKSSFNQINVQEKLMNMTARSNLFNTKLLSKMTKNQKNYFTKDRRYINSYEKQKQYWDQTNHRYKLTKDRKNSLIQRVKQKLFPIPNDKEIDLLNQHIVHYWEMSLRNNQKRILKHFQGAPLQQTEFEQLLQTTNGQRKIAKMVPQLNTQRLKNMQNEQFLIKGKSKAVKQFNSSEKTVISENKPYRTFIDQIYKAKWIPNDLNRKNAYLLPKLLMK